MQQQKKKWRDIVDQVQKYGMEDQIRLKLKERQINKKYLQNLDQQVARHQYYNKLQNQQKIKEREIIEQQVKQQKEKKKRQRRQMMRKQIESKDINYQLIEQAKASKVRQFPSPEHPFVKLCDEQDLRKDATRLKFKLQNQVNSIQQKIKYQQKRERHKTQQQQRQKYINHVQNYYQKKIQDRNIFKKRYLKLSNVERSLMFSMSKHTPDSSSIQKQYNSFNSNQMDQKLQRSRQRQQLDDTLVKINKNIQIPNSSPAFLGRNPITHDRIKQLSYLDYGVRRKPQLYLPQRLKTEGSQSLPQHKKPNSAVEELPMLSNYYTNNLKKQQKVKDINPNNQPVSKSKTEFSQQRYSKPDQIEIAKQRNRIQSDFPNNSNNRKKYMTYDIILGRHKQIYS